MYKISTRCPSSRSTAFGAVRLDSGDAFSELTLEFTRVYIITCGYFQLNFLHRSLFLLFPSRRGEKGGRVNGAKSSTDKKQTYSDSKVEIPLCDFFVNNTKSARGGGRFTDSFGLLFGRDSER